MKPLTVLLEEHRRIARTLDVLERALEALEVGDEPPSQAEMTRIAAYLVEFVDRVHHRKEEVLFALLRPAWPESSDSPFRRLVADHVEEKSRLLGLEDAILWDAAWSVGGRATVGERGRAYLSMARLHMELEERMVFPMIEPLLTDEQREDVARSFASLMEAPGAADTRARLDAIAEQLERRFGAGPGRP